MNTMIQYDIPKFYKFKTLCPENLTDKPIKYVTWWYTKLLAAVEENDYDPSRKKLLLSGDEYQEMLPDGYVASKFLYKN